MAAYYMLLTSIHKLFLQCWPIVASRNQAENRMRNGTGYYNLVGVQELVITQTMFTHNVIQLISFHFIYLNSSTQYWYMTFGFGICQEITLTYCIEYILTRTEACIK